MPGRPILEARARGRLSELILFAVASRLAAMIQIENGQFVSGTGVPADRKLPLAGQASEIKGPCCGGSVDIVAGRTHEPV